MYRGMNAQRTFPARIPAELKMVATLSQLLQRLEASRESVSADQFRSVADRLANALRSAPPGELLDAVLGAFPAAAELYENLNYEQAGLCRSPLEASLNAELKARELLGRLSKPAH